MFDEVIIAIATASGKTPLFSITERRELVTDAVKESLPQRTNIRVDVFEGLLVEYVRSQDAIAIVRGLRVLSDFEYEFQMALMNRKLEDVSTVFLMPHERYTYLDSTIIRELAKHGSDVSGFVPACVEQALRKKFA
jgi:pantetheine-phosphate adenylyltransferase